MLQFLNLLLKAIHDVAWCGLFLSSTPALSKVSHGATEKFPTDFVRKVGYFGKVKRFIVDLQAHSM